MGRVSRFPLFFTIFLITLLAGIRPTPTSATPRSGPGTGSASRTMRQFRSGGHVLGFDADGVTIANGRHMLHERFAGTLGVQPVAPEAPDASGPTPLLERVSYPNLWPGITLTYDAPAGSILRSTFRVAPGADPGRIALRYNVPVRVDEGGNLVFELSGGTLRASAPVAWQEIGGQRRPVTVAFRMEAQGVGFRLAAYDGSLPLTIDPTLHWHTFLGGASDDFGRAIAVDATGNVYVAGQSGSNWGSPIIPFEDQYDAFVAKLDSEGTLLWNTFLGSTGSENATAIAVDGSGNVYVTGESGAEWGSPLIAHAGGTDVFVAKLDGNGNGKWHAFLGSARGDYGGGIAVDAGGNVYVAGASDAEWGSPINFHAGENETFVARLDSNGTLQWNTFLGSTEYDDATAIAVDGSSNVYVTGYSGAEWGSPIRLPTGQGDAFVARLDSDGTLEWNTFLGGTDYDDATAIAVDDSGNVYVTGFSSAEWGSPVALPAGQWDAFAARLDRDGRLQWNTFLGSADFDLGWSIAVDGNGNIYVAGESGGGWGSPVAPHTGDGASDAFLARLDPGGALVANGFLGGTSWDLGGAVAVDRRGNVYVTGASVTGWGSPLNGHQGAYDAFVARVCAGTAVVSTTADSVAGSLRDRLAYVCPGGTVTFDPTLAGSTLVVSTSGGQLPVDRSVTISATVPITISGYGNVRIFNLLPDADIVTLQGLTVGGAYTPSSGGAIYNHGNFLAIRQSVLLGNRADVDGGAIYNNAGTVVLEQSLITNNAAGGSGGGIFNSYGALVIDGSTLFGNTASSANGGGGAVYNGSGSLTVENSTLSGNGALVNGGGIASVGGPLRLDHSTLFDNWASDGTGGVYVRGGPFHMLHNIVAGSAVGDCYNSTGALDTNVNNLVEDGSCNPQVSGDPLLGPLADNGGASVAQDRFLPTHALLPGSPALDGASTFSCLEADQRGLQRPQNGDSTAGILCDIGAVERWRLHAAPASYGLTFSWESAGAGCSYDIFVNDKPYFTPADPPAYTNIVSGFPGQGYTGNVQSNYFFRVRANCPGGAPYSTTVGEFDFPLVAGG